MAVWTIRQGNQFKPRHSHLNNWRNLLPKVQRPPRTSDLRVSGEGSPTDNATNIHMPDMPET